MIDSQKSYYNYTQKNSIPDDINILPFKPKSIEDILTSLKNPPSSSNIPQYTKADKELVMRGFKTERIVEGGIKNLARYSEHIIQGIPTGELLDHQQGWKEVSKEGSVYTSEDITLLKEFIK